jgi:hypothetical protein
MSIGAEAEIIRRMLSEGRLTHVDPDGHITELYGRCPNEDSTAPVHRVERVGNRIAEVVLRCPTCNTDFIAAPEAMHLR